jgi:hypothetical protein
MKGLPGKVLGAVGPLRPQIWLGESIISNPGSLSEMLDLEPHPSPAESESAFGVCLH